MEMCCFCLCKLRIFANLKMKMVKRIFLIVVVGVFAVSCGTYRKIQKSQDPELKYNAAKNYFQDGKYIKAASLFDDLSTYYRGTRKAQEILYMLAESYVGQKDYYSAVEHYKIYVKNFPQGDYIRECTYMKGYCNYLLSPDARLDQTYTHEAISAFEDFVAAFPNSDKVPEAYGYIDELNEKLAYKAYLNAKMYYNLGIYLGNNYRSAIIVAENVLRDYPETKYREDLFFLILSSKYKEAIYSVDEKKTERYREVVDEYYNYENEFPEGKNIKSAKKYLREANNYLKE